jgi:hypothetical protein
MSVDAVHACRSALVFEAPQLRRFDVDFVD